MTPIQEIRIVMSNGDVVDALLHNLGGSFRADFDYRNKIGQKFDPHAGPVTDVQTAFGHMIATIEGVGAIFQASITSVHNPNNTELLSLSDQVRILGSRDITAQVT